MDTDMKKTIRKAGRDEDRNGMKKPRERETTRMSEEAKK